MPATKSLLDGMVRILAGTVALRCKARFFARPVGDEECDEARTLFSEDHALLDALCDQIARQIIAHEGQIPGAYSDLARMSPVSEDRRLSTSEMISKLAQDHEQMVFDTQFVLTLVEELPEAETLSLLLGSISQHDTSARKLRRIIDVGRGPLQKVGRSVRFGQVQVAETKRPKQLPASAAGSSRQAPCGMSSTWFKPKHCAKENVHA